MGRECRGSVADRQPAAVLMVCASPPGRASRLKRSCTTKWRLDPGDDLVVRPSVLSELHHGRAREQFEDRMAPSAGDVLVDRIVDPPPAGVQGAERRPADSPD